MPDDPRVLPLAKARQQVGHEGTGHTARWLDLSEAERKLFLAEARNWLRAAVTVGIAPTAEAPSNEHAAVWIDDEGLLYGDYPTEPGDDVVVRLVWAREQAESRRDLTDRYGATFRLLGWSK